jgi:hypothetical protein
MRGKEKLDFIIGNFLGILLSVWFSAETPEFWGEFANTL